MNNFITLKLDQSQTKDSIKGFSSYNIADSIELYVDTNKSLDCWSIYKHSDNSREWLPCKIIGSRLKDQVQFVGRFFDSCNPNHQLYTIQFVGSCEFAEGTYDSAHHTVDINRTFLREAKDIIFSKDYTMNWQGNFQKDAIEFARQICN
jgi:hypothetical protein